MAIRVPDKPDHEVAEIIVNLKGAIYQQTSEIWVDAKGIVWSVWEWIVGYIFTKSGSSLKTKDGSVIKCKNQ